MQREDGAKSGNDATQKTLHEFYLSDVLQPSQSVGRRRRAALPAGAQLKPSNVAARRSLGRLFYSTIWAVHSPIFHIPQLPNLWKSVGYAAVRERKTPSNDSPRQGVLMTREQSVSFVSRWDQHDMALTHHNGR